MTQAIILGSLAGLSIMVVLFALIEASAAPKRHVCKRKPLAHNSADDGNPDSPMPRVWY